MTARQPANGHRPGPPPDWSAQYQPTGARLLACDRHGCDAKYLDDDPGRRAHVAVFGHSPRPPEPAEAAEPAEGQTT